MVSELLAALDELAELREDEIFDELLPELAELCKHEWLLELLLVICKRKGRT